MPPRKVNRSNNKTQKTQVNDAPNTEVDPFENMTPSEAYDYFKNNDTDEDTRQKILDIIATSATYSYLFAMHINKGRWKPGEASIIKSTVNSYLYIRDFIKKRWVDGEVALFTSPKYTYKYIRDFVKEDLPEAREAVKNDPHYSKMYDLFFEQKEREEKLKAKAKKEES